VRIKEKKILKFTKSLQKKIYRTDVSLSEQKRTKPEGLVCQNQIFRQSEYFYRISFNDSSKKYIINNNIHQFATLL